MSNWARICNIQHDLYWECVGIIFNKAKTQYIQAELILGVRTDLGKDLRNTNKFDHRILQWLHDAIAGKFRFHCVATDKQHFDLLNAPEITNDDLSDVPYKWKNFLESELKAFFKDNPDLIKQICLATTYSNLDKLGYEAEVNIYRSTLIRYKSLLAKKPTQLDLL